VLDVERADLRLVLELVGRHGERLADLEQQAPVIGVVHLICDAYCSGVGSQYDASGEMHDTLLKLVAVQPTSKCRVPPCDL
jgi:hypothetical protein